MSKKKENERLKRLFGSSKEPIQQNKINNQWRTFRPLSQKVPWRSSSPFYVSKKKSAEKKDSFSEQRNREKMSRVSCALRQSANVESEDDRLAVSSIQRKCLGVAQVLLNSVEYEKTQEKLSMLKREMERRSNKRPGSNSLERFGQQKLNESRQKREKSSKNDFSEDIFDKKGEESKEILRKWKSIGSVSCFTGHSPCFSRANLHLSESPVLNRPNQPKLPFEEIGQAKIEVLKQKCRLREKETRQRRFRKFMIQPDYKLPEPDKFSRIIEDHFSIEKQRETDFQSTKSLIHMLAKTKIKRGSFKTPKEGDGAFEELEKHQKKMEKIAEKEEIQKRPMSFLKIAFETQKRKESFLREAVMRNICKEKKDTGSVSISDLWDDGFRRKVLKQAMMAKSKEAVEKVAYYLKETAFVRSNSTLQKKEKKENQFLKELTQFSPIQKAN